MSAYLAPLILLALSVAFWRWSWRADLWMHAISRFVIACALLSWSAVWAMAVLVAG